MQKKISFFLILLLATLASCTSETKATVTISITSDALIAQAAIGNVYEFSFVVEYGTERWVTPADHIDSGAIWTFDNIKQNGNPATPTGLVFADGTVTGTPDPSDLGMWAFDVTVEKKKKIFTSTYYLIVSNPLEIITAVDLGTGMVDEPFSATIQAIFGVSPYFWSIDNYELNATPTPGGFSGLTFSGNGILSGTPVHNDIGVWTFDVTVYDSTIPTQQTDTVNFTVEILKSLTVPLYYATIQDAIDAAAPGNIVKVQDGTYQGDGNRDLDFKGKAITVRGNVTDPTLCIIDCEGTSTDLHRGFVLKNREGLDSVVEGFTVKNGYAPMFSNGYRSGGAIAIDQNAAATVRNMIFEDNTAGNTAAEVQGAAIYVQDNAEIAISDCIFRNNEATTAGGGSYYAKGIIRTGNGTVATITDCTFDGNTVTGYYTQALLNFYYSIVTMTNCIVENNTVTSLNSTNYGLFYIYRAKMDMDNCTISDNTITGTSTLYSLFYNYYAEMTMKDTLIENNTVTGSSTTYGVMGRIYYGSFSMEDSKVINNTSTTNSQNYGIFGYPYRTILTIDNSIISGNTLTAGSTCYGILGYCYYATLDVQNTSISNNKITNTSTTYGSYVYNGTSLFKNCTFSGNNISSTSSVYGGTLCLYYNASTIDSCSFINNKAGNGQGGAIQYRYTSAPTLINSVFAYNDADREGGAIHMYGSSSTQLNAINCTFYKNTSYYPGGALFALGYTNLYNCIFWDNTSTYGLGHQIYHSSYTTTMEYSCYRNNPMDIVNFSAGTGCITSDPYFINTGTTALTGTITFTQDSCEVTGQTGVSQFTTELKPGDMIFLDADGQTFKTTVRSITSNTELILDGPYKGTAAAGGPATVMSVNLRLQTVAGGHANDSPCIDVGDDTKVPAGVTTDRDGNTRKVGIVDMGAYEVQ